MPLAPFPAVAATNFSDCLTNIQNGAWNGSEIMGPNGTDNQGHSVPFSVNTTAITYRQCQYACGSGPEALNWSVFSKQFSAWLLPWLALVSQLPFGDEQKVDDLMAVLLTLGSPTLAAYSLACTILNGYWLNERLKGHTNTNLEHVVHVLNNLQQHPLQLQTSDRRLLISLVNNKRWWAYLGERLANSSTWTISSATAIAWVAIAYIFTVIDSFTDLTDSINENGQGVGSVWLWLLPIVVGWFQCLTKNNLKKDVKKANEDYGSANTHAENANTLAENANTHAENANTHTENANTHVGNADTLHDGSVDTHINSVNTHVVISPGNRPHKYAISLEYDPVDPFLCETGLTNPIYNYIRFFPWIHAVEIIAMGFEGKLGNDPGHHLMTFGSSEYIPLAHIPIPFHRHAWTSRVWSLMFYSSILALSLQWGTAGSAFIVVWFTPTISESSMMFSSKYTDLTQLFFKV